MLLDSTVLIQVMTLQELCRCPRAPDLVNFCATVVAFEEKGGGDSSHCALEHFRDGGKMGKVIQ